MMRIQPPLRTPTLSLRRLTAADRAAVRAHLLSLPPDDRRLRFGHGSAEPIGRYVDAIDFDRQHVFGAFTSHGELVALAHLPIVHGVAELGVSVSPRHRRRRLGLQLARRALDAALGAGAREFRFEFAPANEPMRRIAQALGLDVRRDGTELAARRRLIGAAEAVAA
jgi:RimJ/RimL family protein N-acetyltransferase